MIKWVIAHSSALIDSIRRSIICLAIKRGIKYIYEIGMNENE